MTYQFTGYVDGWWLYQYYSQYADRTRDYETVVQFDGETPGAYHVTGLYVPDLEQYFKPLFGRPDTRINRITPVNAFLPKSVVTISGKIERIS